MRDTLQKQFGLELDLIYKNQTKPAFIIDLDIFEMLQNQTSNTRDKPGTSERKTGDKKCLLTFNVSYFYESYCFPLFWHAKFCPQFVPPTIRPQQNIAVYQQIIS